MKPIPVEEFFDIFEDIAPAEFKVHVEREGHIIHPLALCDHDPDAWCDKRQKLVLPKTRYNNYSRPYVFSLVQISKPKDLWMFGGIYCTGEPKKYVRYDGKSLIGYHAEMFAKHSEHVGRVEISGSENLRQARFQMSESSRLAIIRELFDYRHGYDLETWLESMLVVKRNFSDR